MKWKNKKILVTGAGGFIGSHLVERLTSMQADVTCFVRYTSLNSWGFLDDIPNRKSLNIISADLKDSDAVRKAVKNNDMVFHLAAAVSIPHSYDFPREHLQTNIMGTFNVLSAAREFSIKKLVHLSSSEVYGTALEVPIKENHPLQGQSPYSATKIAADKLAESFYLSYDVPVAIARPFNTFGPRQSARAIIPTIITQALSSNKILIGNEKPTRDLNFVENTVDGIIGAAQSEKSVGEVINLGSGTDISIGELAKKILSLSGKSAKIVQDKQRFRPEKSEVMRLVADNTKAKKLLGWEPKISLDEGLRKTIEWISNNLNLYKAELYNK
jgi:NAD dependent epimerase/dehydratase|tara:strand:- start:1583 stop:2566 length:984 start_codon:yes stop_codon:yes gene_type:complete